jgi:hypothetical protein
LNITAKNGLIQYLRKPKEEEKWYMKEKEYEYLLKVAKADFLLAKKSNK